MNKYIDVELVKKEHERFIGYLDEDMILRLNLAVDKIQAADVAPVVHGHWTQEGLTIARCSACNGLQVIRGRDKTGHAKIHNALYKYCPNCGAMMDLEV